MRGWKGWETSSFEFPSERYLNLCLRWPRVLILSECCMNLSIRWPHLGLDAYLHDAVLSFYMLHSASVKSSRVSFVVCYIDVLKSKKASLIMLQPRGKIRKMKSRAKHSKSKDGIAHLHKVIFLMILLLRPTCLIFACVKGTKNAMQHNWVLFQFLFNAIKTLPKHLNDLHKAMKQCKDKREKARVNSRRAPFEKIL